MIQAIVIFPYGKDFAIIDAIRRKYDPQFRVVKPHVTLAYPFRDIPAKVIDDHIKGSVSGISPFFLRLKGVKKSPKEYYLYLLVDAGIDAVLQIHGRLYQKILEERTDIPYIPHLTLGVFKSKVEIDRAYKHVERMDLDLACMINEMFLLTVADDLVSLISAKKYVFKG